MSLEYYLYCRKEYDNIISYIDAIIDKYDLINDITLTETNLDNNYCQIFKPEHNKYFFIEKQKHIKELKKICNEKIQELCNHDYVDDLIDVTPDKSIYIRYCKICEYTEK
jgi:hypothetical protein